MKKADNTALQHGRILSCVGGLYTVESSSGIITACKARGVFRNQGITPYAGDMVAFKNGVINEVLPRKNSIIRPPLANLDRLIFVVSLCKPVPNYLLLDKFIAVARYKNIEPIIVITKTDLSSDEQLRRIYEKAEIKIISVDYNDPTTIESVAELIEGKISAFTGNTGVGKSTLLNHIAPELDIPVGEVSDKLGRGRHTTRKAFLYPILGGYIADTPGFSTFETQQYADIKKEELADCFPEFASFTGKCRFSDCAHICEKGCAVLEAVHDGKIEKSRHSSYAAMYEEAKLIKDWEKQ